MRRRYCKLSSTFLFSSSMDTATALGLYYLLVQNYKNGKKRMFQTWKFSGSQFGRLKHCHFRRTGKEAELFCDELSKRIDEAFGVGQVGLDQRPSYEVSEIVFCAPFLESDFFFLAVDFSRIFFAGNCGSFFFLNTRPGRMSRCWFSKISTSRRLLAKQWIRFCRVLKEA